MVRLSSLNRFKPSIDIFANRSKAFFFCGSFLLFWYHVYLCYTVLSVPCSLVIPCWDKADLLALLHVVFSCVFVTFPYGILVQVWYTYLFVLIADLCPPLY